MAEIDLQVGGGNVYQWESAVLLALNYLVPGSVSYNPRLHSLIRDELGQVQAIHLEGEAAGQDIQLEDINLLAEPNVICMQVKTKQPESGIWTPSDRLLLKALYKFYTHATLDRAEALVRFVFFSNRGFNSDLVSLQHAINDRSSALVPQANDLFTYLERYSLKNHEVQLDRTRFDRMLERLTLIEFLPLEALEAIVQEKLQALGQPDSAGAYDRLYKEFSKRSVIKGGSRITKEDLKTITGGFFTGQLIDFIDQEPLRTVANYLLSRAQLHNLPPLGTTSTAVRVKIEQVIGNNPKAMNSVEAFVLIAALCLPHLLRLAADTIPGLPTGDHVQRLITELAHEPDAPLNLVPALNDVAEPVRIVASARTGLSLGDADWGDTALRRDRVRLRLLGALLHLAATINLDQYIYPSIPQALMQSSPIERIIWWRQAYVHGVQIEDHRLHLWIQLPRGKSGEYTPILVEPLDEEIRRLIHSYDDVLRLAGIILVVRTPTVTEGMAQAIPDEEWPEIRRIIATEQARKVEARLQQTVIVAQQQRELLVRSEVQHAERLVAEGQHLVAAKMFERVAELLHSAPYQAAAYADQAAQQYLAGIDHFKAVQCYLQAAEILLDNALTPELADRPLRQARTLADELDSIELTTSVLLTQARFDWATLTDDAAKRLEQAWEHLPQIVDPQQRAHLLSRIAVERVIFALVDEAWGVARTALDAALAMYQSVSHQQHLELLRLQIQLATVNGDWDTADRAYQEGQPLFSAVNNIHQQALFTLQYGVSLARRGEPETGAALFNQATQLFEDDANLYGLWLTYENMQHGFIRLDMRLLPDLETHDKRRLDLFNSIQAQNKGYAHELHAKADLAEDKENYRDALKHLRMALYYFWREGSWLGIEQAYATLSRVWSRTEHPVDALLAAVRACDGKQTEAYSAKLRDRGDRTQLTEVITKLVQLYPTANEQKVTAKALGMLADVVTPDDLHNVIEHLSALICGPEVYLQQMEVRRTAAAALGEFVPQLTEEQTARVIHLALTQLEREQWWTVTEQLLKLVYRCVVYGKLSAELHGLLVETMFKYTGNGSFREWAERVAVHVARSASPDLRMQVVEYLRSRSTSIDYLSLLAFMREPIEEQEIETCVDQVLQAIVPQPQVVEDGQTRQVTRAIGAVVPRTLNNFNDVLSPELNERVIDGLLAAIINEDTDLWVRADAMYALSNLPESALIARADEIADYLLWGAEGTLPQSTFIGWQEESQTNPFSNFRMNMGNTAEVRRSSLFTLGKLYQYVEQERRAKIVERLIQASTDQSSVVRQAVGLALSKIQSDDLLPTRLLLKLVVLLHDQEVEPCAWACRASGHLVVRGLADTFATDLLERLLELAQPVIPTDIRVGAALGLRTLRDSNWSDLNARAGIEAALAMLVNDVSFKVRRAAMSPS